MITINQIEKLRTKVNDAIQTINELRAKKRELEAKLDSANEEIAKLKNKELSADAQDDLISEQLGEIIGDLDSNLSTQELISSAPSHKLAEAAEAPEQAENEALGQDKALDPAQTKSINARPSYEAQEDRADPGKTNTPIADKDKSAGTKLKDPILSSIDPALINSDAYNDADDDLFFSLETKDTGDENDDELEIF